MAPAAEIHAPLAIPPLGPPPAEPEGLRFAAGAAPPAGCFARSLRTGALACVTGHFHPHGDGERRLDILSNDDEPTAPIDLEGGPVLAEASRAKLNTLLRAGEFVPLTSHRSRQNVGPSQRFGPFHVQLQRSSYSDDADTGTVVRTDLVLDVTADADPEPEVLFHNTLRDVACDVATVDLRELDPRTILLERECQIGDEIYLTAALCNGALGRCD